MITLLLQRRGGVPQRSARCGRRARRARTRHCATSISMWPLANSSRIAGPVRLRQIHVAVPDRRVGRGQRRRDLVVWRPRGEAVAGTQPDLPGDLAVSLASVWQNVSFGLSIKGVSVAERKELGAPRAGPGGAVRGDGQAAGRILRRHAAARRGGARLGDAAASAADGRAFRRAGCADARQDAGFPAGCVAQCPALRCCS